jgi:hypothetical protein
MVKLVCCYKYTNLKPATRKCKKVVLYALLLKHSDIDVSEHAHLDGNEHLGASVWHFAVSTRVDKQMVLLPNNAKGDKAQFWVLFFKKKEEEGQSTFCRSRLIATPPIRFLDRINGGVWECEGLQETAMDRKSATTLTERACFVLTSKHQRKLDPA